MIDILDAKRQCNIDVNDNSDDVLLFQYIEAAKRSIENSLNRRVYDTQELLDADSEAPVTAIVANDDIKQGCRMLVSHWYANREAVTADNTRQQTLALQYLLNPHRCITV